MRILCILNPLSAGGLAVQRWPSVEALLRRFGVQYELLAPEAQPIGGQLAAALVREGPGAYQAIAGIGGDGTHSAAINSLMRYGADHPGVELPPYAFIPLGTGNDIAKSFGITAREDFFVNDLRRAVATIVHGADYRLDLGKVGELYFADAVTVGLDSRILQERNRQKFRLQSIPVLRRLARGSLLYTLSTGKLFWRQHPLDVAIDVDGREWYRGPILNLLVNNTRIYAGEFDLSPDAFEDDGLLDLVLFAGRTDYLRKYLLAIRHNPDRIRDFSERLDRLATHAQGREFDIRLSRPEALQADGEEHAVTDRFRITVAPRAIHIKTPAEPA